MFQRSTLLFAIALGAVLHVARVIVLRISPVHATLVARSEGRFTEGGGWHPGEPLVSEKSVRAWGSWCDSDAHTGSLTLGPFPAPARLRFAVSGYPLRDGNEIVLQLAAPGARHPVSFATDIGERWRIIDVSVPAAWVGQPLLLVATDRAQGVGGWLAVTEPLRGGRGEDYGGLLDTFSAWAINGLLLGLLGHAAVGWLARRFWLAPAWLALAAGGLVAIGGYLVFWIYFASALAGKGVSAALLIGAVAYAWRTSPLPDVARREVLVVARAMLALGALHLALLQLYPSARAFDDLAANRYRENLPGDNTLPHNLARALVEGDDPKRANGEWQSSDRPPLQTGWLLLTWPATAALGIESRTASGTAATWFQLLWVAAVYGLLRSLTLNPARAIAWTVVIGLSGFCVQNTVFTWPKLAAGAFACGAFGLWLLPAAGPHRRATILIGAALAALGWLAHGGVAFSYLALVPFLVWRFLADRVAEPLPAPSEREVYPPTAAPKATRAVPLRTIPPIQALPWRDWLLALGVFLLLALPWTAYQKFYDPPGNQLLKLHLAGHDGPDPRGTWQTIRDAYRPLSWSEIMERRRANIALQVGGGWVTLFDFSAAGASARREAEFFRPARALTWWVLGLAALPMLLLHRARRSTLRAQASAHATLAAWPLLTTLIWCGLMFSAGNAVIHQGSYAVMLSSFVLLSLWLELASRWTIVVVAGLQIATLATTYSVPNAIVQGPPLGLPLVLLIAAAVTAWIIRELRSAA